MERLIIQDISHEKLNTSFFLHAPQTKDPSTELDIFPVLSPTFFSLGVSVVIFAVWRWGEGEVGRLQTRKSFQGGTFVSGSSFFRGGGGKHSPMGSVSVRANLVLWWENPQIVK